MKFTYHDYEKMADCVKRNCNFQPALGAVLGSGLGDFVSQIEVVGTVPYNEIPGLPVSTNKAHKGQFVFGYFQGIPVVLMQGRIHCYEGYTSEEAVAPIRLMKLLGIKGLILTNAAGAINTSFHPGDLMMIDDHIACLIKSPLIGENIEQFGTRFPDMSDIYSETITDQIVNEANKEGLNVQRGVYMQFYGPQYESKAEIHMARAMGADAAGMSTAIEAIAANHVGIKTVGISLLTNMAAGILKEKLSDAEVLEVAEKSSRDITKLFAIALKVMAENV